jgi:hypothetical protein
MFKCNWADNTSDTRYKVDEYDITLVNFKNLVHTGKQIMDDLYVLTSQVDQVYYVEDESNLDWACIVRTKPRNVYDVGQGEGPNDASVNYHQIERLLLNSNHDLNPPDLAPIKAHVI